jgi:conserved oligomeric Golgi complex subunit 2
LTPTFSAAEYLSTLTTRFQTLEDLQSELQDLLNSLNKGLVDLVNDNYTSFLNLGQKLSGGEERIEQVRVGLLGFQRDVTGLRDLVNVRSQEVRALLEQKRSLRKHLQLGRALLDVDERITDLEERLNLTSGKLHELNQEEDIDVGFKDWSDDWSRVDELSDDDTDDGDLPRRLRKSVEDFLIVQQISKTCGRQHPFIQAQSDRVDVIGSILRRDMEAAIRAQNDIKIKQKIIQLKARLEDHV